MSACFSRWHALRLATPVCFSGLLLTGLLSALAQPVTARASALSAAASASSRLVRPVDNDGAVEHELYAKHDARLEGDVVASRRGGASYGGSRPPKRAKLVCSSVPPSCA
jgi:hypothetical protein